MNDLEEVTQSVKRTPEDVERQAFFAAALGMLRGIRLIVIACLITELVGRVIQVTYIYFPGVFGR